VKYPDALNGPVQNYSGPAKQQAQPDLEASTLLPSPNATLIPFHPLSIFNQPKTEDNRDAQKIQIFQAHCRHSLGCVRLSPILVDATRGSCPLLFLLVFTISAQLLALT
jgi:hypothetical protein